MVQYWVSPAHPFSSYDISGRDKAQIMEPSAHICTNECSIFILKIHGGWTKDMKVNLKYFLISTK